MDNEKIQKEFEGWCESMPSTTWITSRSAYFAAAQSRDELIGKLVVALRTCESGRGFMNDQMQYDYDKVEQALAAAKAQGYGE